jgi:phosphoribosyl-ATP pyrophosphohydrolase/phosphoribosyl-AMP cyclohydrolase
MAVDPQDVRWDEHGLVPAIVQDATTRSVLMLGYMNEESLRLTLDSGEVHFWSRSRAEIWRKGATSGNTLALDALTLDCDNDAVLVEAIPAGPTCHTGDASCFDGDAEPAGIARLWATISERAANPTEGSYTAELIAGGTDATSRKVVEESGEVLIAAKNHEFGGDPQRVIEESADLVYHLLVLLAEQGLDLSDVEQELDLRSRP